MLMTDPKYNVLFLCTGNSARSILAESILNHKWGSRFHGFSAGSHPAGKVNPDAVELLERLGFPTDGLRSKSWDEFARAGAPALDFIFTVCDNAAGELCPIWHGKPMTAHWGVPDPAHIEDPVARALAFQEAFRHLSRRIELFANLPISSLDNMTLGRELREIGKVSE
jgi:arsenate reductase (thioredoxin)